MCTLVKNGPILASCKVSWVSEHLNCHMVKFSCITHSFTRLPHYSHFLLCFDWWTGDYFIFVIDSIYTISKSIVLHFIDLKILVTLKKSIFRKVIESCIFKLWWRHAVLMNKKPDVNLIHQFYCFQDHQTITRREKNLRHKIFKF